MEINSKIYFSQNSCVSAGIKSIYLSKTVQLQYSLESGFIYNQIQQRGKPLLVHVFQVEHGGGLFDSKSKPLICCQLSLCMAVYSECSMAPWGSLIQNNASRDIMALGKEPLPLMFLHQKSLTTEFTLIQMG